MYFRFPISSPSSKSPRANQSSFLPPEGVLLGGGPIGKPLPLPFAGLGVGGKLENDGVPGTGGGKLADKDGVLVTDPRPLMLTDPPEVLEWYKEEGRELPKDALGMGVPGVELGSIGELTDGVPRYGEVGIGENVDDTGVPV